MKTRGSHVILLATALLASACQRSAAPELPPTIELRFGTHVLTVEVAATPESRARGLMFRRELPENQGMLFVHPSAQPLAFWMRNTFVPLSIAFLDAEGRILNIEQMEPFDAVTRHRSAGPARYALEVGWGWFQQRQIRPGATASFTLPKGLFVR